VTHLSCTVHCFFKHGLRRHVVTARDRCSGRQAEAAAQGVPVAYLTQDQASLSQHALPAQLVVLMERHPAEQTENEPDLAAVADRPGDRERLLP
jgi:hypothetical protein